MSTRWYPIYQFGNPQLRIFLPNFWMKLIRPKEKQPENVVTFAVSLQMTTRDIENYLRKIYKLPVINVRTRIAMGRTRREPGAGYIIKDEDTKIAFVTLPKNEKFTFPDLFEGHEKKKEEHDRTFDETKQGFKNFLDKNKKRSNTPGWYSF